VDPPESARAPQSGGDDAIACIVGIPRDRGKRIGGAGKGNLQPLCP
jgi:hypothetical protein